MTATLSLSFAALNIDCADPAALADFWGKILGRPASPGAVAGDMAIDADPASGPRMIFHPVLPSPGRPRTASVLSCSPTTTTRRPNGCPVWAPRRSTRPSSRQSAGPRSPTRRKDIVLSGH